MTDSIWRGNHRACLLCGQEGAPVEVLTVEWREPRYSWTTIPRCLDRVACRIRVEDAGDDWAVADGTPPTVRARLPEQPGEPRAADVGELATVTTPVATLAPTSDTAASAPPEEEDWFA